MMENYQVRFLGEGETVMSLPYPTCEVIDKAGIDKKSRPQIYSHAGRSDYLNG
jgi:hypothetical protein